ncbi:MAG: hypothetical protein COT74_09195 [Bdellovibrionales bacterium CG10_big_fil_rev_8_21_14_0_10_45_34]|nr:MAG: hypothetical protein COT74_09195 [Bdellovibrionales bacterium CG10_big_fil_rev_8_21_14_0_10_45_34]
MRLSDKGPKEAVRPAVLVAKFEPPKLEGGARAKRPIDSKEEFRMSSLLADRLHFSELEQKKLEGEIEKLTVEKMKGIEEQAYKEAYSLGLKEGKEDAYVEAKEQISSDLKALADLVAKMNRLKSDLIQSEEGQIIRLTYAIASKISFQKIEEDPDLIKELLRAVVEDIGDEEQVNVELSEKDFETVERLRASSDSELDFLNRFRFSKSEKIKKGGCYIETNHGSIDATIEERLARAWDLIAQRRPKIRDNVA